MENRFVAWMIKLNNHSMEKASPYCQQQDGTARNMFDLAEFYRIVSYVKNGDKTVNRKFNVNALTMIIFSTLPPYEV